MWKRHLECLLIGCLVEALDVIALEAGRAARRFKKQHHYLKARASSAPGDKPGPTYSYTQGDLSEDLKRRLRGEKDPPKQSAPPAPPAQEDEGYW